MSFPSPTGLRLVCSAALALCLPAAAGPPLPAGLWQTIDDVSGRPRVLMRLMLRDGVLSGRVERMLDPRDDPAARCERCPDARRDQPILGMTVLNGLRQSPEDPALWDGGEGLDPEDGRLYRVRMRVLEDGRVLQVRGYVAVPLLGRTQTWLRSD